LCEFVPEIHTGIYIEIDSHFVAKPRPKDAMAIAQNYHYALVYDVVSRQVGISRRGGAAMQALSGNWRFLNHSDKYQRPSHNK